MNSILETEISAGEEVQTPYAFQIILSEGLRPVSAVFSRRHLTFMFWCDITHQLNSVVFVKKAQILTLQVVPL